MHPIIGFVAPSGGGKTTMILELLRQNKQRFGAVKTLTTRAPRATNDDKLFYDYTTSADILQKQAENKIIQVSEYAGHLYANERDTVSELLKEKIGLMAIVESGVKNFRAAGYRVIVIRLIPEGAHPPEDLTRKIADINRAKENLPADFTLINSFAPGGKEEAVKELLAFIETIQ